MIESIIELFSYAFILRALIGGLALSVIAPIFGNYLLITKSPHYGDSISHIALFGVMFASIFGLNIFILTFVLSIAASVLVKFVDTEIKIQKDATLVILTVLSLALISIFNKYTNINIENLFFGSLLNISFQNLVFILIISLLVLILFIWNYKDILNMVLFGKYSKFNDTNFNLVGYGIVISMGLFISVSINIFGGLLISGIMIMPPLIAKNFNLNFKNTMILSSAIGAISLILGFFSSFILDLPAGSSIVLILISMLVLSLFAKR